MSATAITISSPSSALVGKSELHIASKEGRTDQVRELIQLGALVDGIDSNGKSALYYAAKYGHIESVALLLQGGWRPDLANLKGITPLDIALRKESDEVVRLMIFGGERGSSLPSSSDAVESPSPSPSSSKPSDSEGEVYRSFLEALKQGDLHEQIFCLMKLASFRLTKEEYRHAALILNSACAVAEKHSISSQLRELLLSQLAQIETSFIRDQMKRDLNRESRIHSYRVRLKQIRGEVSRSLELRQPSDQISRELTQHYKKLLSDLLSECVEIAGPPPTRFAMVGLGSMSRDEMCPYSGIDFFFLINDSQTENRNYFRILAQLLQIKVINLGETSFNDPRCLNLSGFRMSRGGLSPFGMEGNYELIGTPKELARLHREDWFRQNNSEIILLNAMATVSCVSGSKSLVTAYQKEINEILDVSSFFDFFKPKLREVRALEWMRGYIFDSKPILDQFKIELRAFDVKRDFYRLLQNIINGLAFYHHLNSNSTFERLDELRAKNIISSAGAHQLKKALRAIIQLRIEAHLFYKTAREIFYFSRGVSDDEEEKELLKITPELNRQIVEIYRTLIPLHRSAQAFVQGDSEAFASSSFYDPTVGHYDERAATQFQFATALASAESSVVLSPSSSSARRELGLVQLKVGKAEDAIKSFGEALALLKEQHGDRPHSEIASVLRDIGDGYRVLGEFGKAIEHYEDSLSVRRVLNGGDLPHLAIADILTNLGVAYKGLGEFQKAIGYYNASLSMRKELNGGVLQASSENAETLTHLGAVFQSLGKFRNAIKQYNASLEIYGDTPRPEVAANLMSLGRAHESLGEFERAMGYYDASLAMKKIVYQL